jgi:hypothetical protein
MAVTHGIAIMRYINKRKTVNTPQLFYL